VFLVEVKRTFQVTKHRRSIADSLLCRDEVAALPQSKHLVADVRKDSRRVRIGAAVSRQLFYESTLSWASAKVHRHQCVGRVSLDHASGVIYPFLLVVLFSIGSFKLSPRLLRFETFLHLSTGRDILGQSQPTFALFPLLHLFQLAHVVDFDFNHGDE